MISQTKTQKLQTPLEQQALVGDQRKVPKFTLKLPPKLKISNQIESNDLYSEKVSVKCFFKMTNVFDYF